MHTTAISSLQNECGELPLALRRRKQQLEYAAKIKSEQDHPSIGVLKEHWYWRYRTYGRNQDPLAIKVNRVFTEQKWKRIQQRINPKPPWEQLSNKLNIDTTLIGRTSKQNKETAKLDSRTLIDSYSQHLHVFTDASKAKNGRCAAAYYVPENDTRKIIPL